MSSLQEFFNQPENGKAKGIVQKNNILNRNIIARMAIEGECTLADLARELHVSIPTVTKLVEELLSENIIADRGHGDFLYRRALRRRAWQPGLPGAVHGAAR